MGRKKLPDSECGAPELEAVASQVAEAIIRADFERARALTEEAIRAWASKWHSPPPNGES